MAEPTLVEYSRKLQSAVDTVVAGMGYTEHEPNYKHGRSSLTDRASGAFEDEYNGPFKFSLDDEDNIVVSPGFLNRNGDFFEIKELKIKPKTGYVCLESKLEEKDGKNQWTEPALVILEKPTATAYPLGYCTLKNANGNGNGNNNSENNSESEEELDVEGYRVTVAFILATRQCPLASGSNNGANK